jgi:PPOX class probable F420-dependent enzyme
VTEHPTYPHPDLLQIPYATLATINPDGSPQLTEIVFLHDPDDGFIKISLNDTRQKTRNLRRDPRMSLFFIDPETPLRTMEIRATADIQPDTDFAVAERVGAKYGMDFRAHDKPGETRSITTVRPHKITTADLRPPTEQHRQTGR